MDRRPPTTWSACSAMPRTASTTAVCPGVINLKCSEERVLTALLGVGLAARALGLLMLRDPALTARLRLEAEDLVDALLQLVNYCRRTSVQNADTRRVHVNACLVISLLMQGWHNCFVSLSVVYGNKD